MQRFTIAASLLMGGILLTGCADSLPSTVPSSLAYVPGPAPANYVGTTQDSTSGAGTARVTIAVAEGLASGTWDMSFPSARPDSIRYLSGTVTGANLVATMQQSWSNPNGSGVVVPDCKLRFDGTLTSDSLSGTYASVPTSGCPDRQGTVNATRQ